MSDGQRSLFHLAMTAATLDVEAGIVADPAAAGFQAGGVPLPALTLIAVEEPENNLAPFYLSRIVQQIRDLTKGPRAQALVSSHSPSILARVDPAAVRHFRLDPHTPEPYSGSTLVGAGLRNQRRAPDRDWPFWFRWLNHSLRWPQSGMGGRRRRSRQHRGRHGYILQRFDLRGERLNLVRHPFQIGLLRTDVAIELCKFISRHLLP